MSEQLDNTKPFVTVERLEDIAKRSQEAFDMHEELASRRSVEERDAALRGLRAELRELD